MTGFDWTLPARAERYLFEQLDTGLRRVGALGGVRGCQLDWTIYSPNRGSGDLEVRTARPLMWPQVVVRPWIVVSNRSGREAVPLMTALCKVPDATHTPRGVEVSVELHDLTMALAEWVLRVPFVASTTEPVTAQIKAVFVSLGYGDRVVVTDSPATLPEARVWHPLDESPPLTWLDVLNELCREIGYASVHTDARGRFLVRPYVAPSRRTPQWRFAQGAAQFLPTIGVRSEADVTYNAWSYWSKGDEATPPVEYFRVNDDPEHPYSTVSLGRQITRPKSGLEGDVAAQLDREMALDMSDQRTFSVAARYVPIVEDEAAEVASSSTGLGATTGVLTKRSLRCKPGALLDLTFREAL